MIDAPTQLAATTRPSGRRADFERTAFWLTAVLAAFVHWIPHFPPQIDLAQHAAQMRFLRDWNQAEFPYRDILQLNFFTPYLPAYFVGAALTFVMPVVAAVKTVWTLGALGTVFASVRLRRLVGGEECWDWILIPGLFGITFVWGFLTFQFTIPLGLLGLECWIRYLHHPTPARGFLFGTGLAALFFCHSLVTAWLMAVCGLMLLSDAALWTGNRRRAVAVGLPLLMPLPVAAAWLAMASKVPQAQAATVWGSIEYRVLGFFAQSLGVPTGYMAASIIGILLYATPFLAGARIRQDPVFRAPLVVTLGILLLAPGNLMGNAFTYHRFHSLLAPTLIIALSARAPNSFRLARARLAAPAIAVFATLLLAWRMLAFDREQQDFRDVTAAMLDRRHTLSVILDPSSGVLQHPQTYLHFGAWYQAERGGLVEFSFASFLPMIVHFRTSYAQTIPEAFALRPTLGVVRNHGEQFEYVLVRTPSSDLSPLAGMPFTVRTHRGQWWLFSSEKGFRELPRD